MIRFAGPAAEAIRSGASSVDVGRTDAIQAQSFLERISLDEDERVALREELWRLTRTEVLLPQSWTLIERLAEALMKTKRLEADEIAAIVPVASATSAARVGNRINKQPKE
jgi:hypothetical protein